MTIVDVSASSQMSPTMTSTKPTSSHDEKPRFLSHAGAENCDVASSDGASSVRPAPRRGSNASERCARVHVRARV